jgi:dTDP-4-amino-4,6-dideoxygalactose transaminase
MKAKEVGYAFHYPIPCHLQKAYHFLNHKVGDMPNSEYLANHCVSLPMFPEMTNDEISSVIKCLNTFN